MRATDMCWENYCKFCQCVCVCVDIFVSFVLVVIEYSPAINCSLNYVNGRGFWFLALAIHLCISHSLSQSVALNIRVRMKPTATTKTFHCVKHSLWQTSAHVFDLLPQVKMPFKGFLRISGKTQPEYKLCTIIRKIFMHVSHYPFKVR